MKFTSKGVITYNFNTQEFALAGAAVELEEHEKNHHAVIKLFAEMQEKLSKRLGNMVADNFVGVKWNDGKNYYHYPINKAEPPVKNVQAPLEVAFDQANQRYYVKQREAPNAAEVDDLIKYQKQYEEIRAKWANPILAKNYIVDLKEAPAINILDDGMKDGHIPF